MTGRFLESNTAALRHGGLASDSDDILLRAKRQAGALGEAGIAGAPRFTIEAG